MPSTLNDSSIDAPRVLIADDQTDVLQALTMLLAREGVACDAVTSPEAVLDALRHRRFDAVLMDLNYTRDTTSGVEGLDLVARIRHLDDQLPIVVMTGWGSVDGAVEALRLGARDYVQKPWDNVRLLTTVKAEVTRGRDERRRTELRAREQADARDVQCRLLPRACPVIPGWSIAATWRPLHEVGGDGFDVLELDEGVWAIAIADSIGKGVAAALLMAHLQATVRAVAEQTLDPAAVCDRVNRALVQQLRSHKFVSFCYATIDERDGRLRYTNAGHNPPVLVRRSGEIVRLDRGGPVLGLFDARYLSGELAIEPEDRFVFFTDGIVEARNAADEEFGDHRLVQMAHATRTLGADAMQQRLLAAVTGFCAGQFADDATLLVAGPDDRMTR